MRQFYKQVFSVGTIYLALAFHLLAQSPLPKDSLKVKPFHQKSPATIQSIDANKLPTVPTFSLDQALVGNVAGALLSSVSGKPGSSVNIQLRGFNSISGGTMPLVLVDEIGRAHV